MYALVHLLDGGLDNSSQLLISLLQIVVHYHMSEPQSFGHLQLMLAVLQTELNCLGSIRTTTTQTAGEFLEGWGLDEHKRCLHSGLHHLLHSLHVDIQNANLVVVYHLHHTLERGSINIAMHVRMLNELALGNFLLHILLLREIVINLVVTVI